MEHKFKKKKRKGKRKFPSTDSNNEEETKNQKPSKIRSNSLNKLQNELNQKRISIHSSNFIPTQVCELDHLVNLENSHKKKEDNYYEIIGKNRKKIKAINNLIDEEYDNRNNIFEFLNQLKIDKDYEEIKCAKRIKEIPKEIDKIEILKKDIVKKREDYEKSEVEKKAKKKLLESKDSSKNLKIMFIQQEIEKERLNLNNQRSKNKKGKEIIFPQLKEDIEKLEEEINEQKNLMKELIEKKNKLREDYLKINKIVINDNKFCHQNFFSLLPLFPYYKNVAFISTEINGYHNINNQNEEINENKITTNEQLMDDIENEDINNIKFLLKQKEESEKNINYKILNDRRTLQFNPKEKYKFSKIFSLINNNYIAEPWNLVKYISLKLNTINSYFNEFNMTAISNNYFIIYFVPSLDKSCLKGELYSLYQGLRNNEYIDKNMTIRISAITESNYINLQNINDESNIKAQIETINNSGMQKIHGFLYEFIKSNRLNKKNIFRIYNFDYSYPQAIDMMNNISKYYAKKKRKKTGVYKKVIKGAQPKVKKRQPEKSVKKANNSTNNNIKNNNLNKGNIKSNNNQGNKKNNMNKAVKFKKSVIFTNNNNKNASNNNINVTNLNKSFIASNKKEKRNNNSNNKKSLNLSSIDNKKILKKSGSSQQPHNKKEKNVRINSKNNIKLVKIEDKRKSITPKKNTSANRELIINKTKINNIVFNDLKTIKPEHTLILHDINDEFINSDEFKKVVKACGILNNNDK